MNFEPSKPTLNQEPASFQFRELIEEYQPYGRWFILSIVLCLICAFLFLRYTPKQYLMESTILIKDQGKGNSFQDLSSFEELGLFNSGENALENEQEIIGSRKLMTRVVEELRLNEQFFLSQDPIDIEIYPDFPLLVNNVENPEGLFDLNSEFSVLIKSESSFEVFDFDDNNLGVKRFGQDFEINLGSVEKSTQYVLNVDLGDDVSIKELIGTRVYIKYRSVKDMVNELITRLTIELPPDERFSRVLRISLKDTHIEKGITIINNLIEQYNADGIEYNNQAAAATTRFLDDRLILMANELEAIEKSAAQFKTGSSLIDSERGRDIYLESSNLAEGDLVAANTQLQLVNFMISELNNVDHLSLLPSNIGVSDPGIINLIGDHNDLVLQKNRILKSSSVKNPIIVNLDSQISTLRNSLLTNLNSLKSKTEIEIQGLTAKSGRINTRIASAPLQESKYKEIIRDQNTKNELYLFLLQKREESILSNAVAVEKAQIIDPAYSNEEPVSRKNY